MGAGLRITRRCMLEDLQLEPEECSLPLDQLAERHPLVRAFAERRGKRVEGQEAIQGLTSRIVAFSLHGGRDRGLTWHHEKADIVWLLAARLHRSGDREDAYPHFRQLDAAGRLLPTREDVLAALEVEPRRLAEVLQQEIPPIKNAAQSTPGTICEAVLGERIRVRFVYEEGDPPMATLAISQRLMPGPMEVPPEWQLIVAAGFLPSTSLPEDLSFAADLVGEPLRDDEIAYCDFAHDW